MEKAGVIQDLQLQVRFPITVNLMKICEYVCDFTYWEGEEYVVADVKGIKTPVYLLKKKLLYAIYGIEVREM